jgi:hypothetical protein
MAKMTTQARACSAHTFKTLYLPFLYVIKFHVNLFWLNMNCLKMTGTTEKLHNLYFSPNIIRMMKRPIHMASTVNVQKSDRKTS